MTRPAVRFQQREAYRKNLGLPSSRLEIDGYTLVVCNSSIDKPVRCEIYRGDYLRGWVVLGPDDSAWGGIGPQHVRDAAARLLRPPSVKDAARARSEQARRRRRRAEGCKAKS